MWQVDRLLADDTEAHVFQKRHTLRQHNRRTVMIKLQRNRIRPIGAVAIKIDEERLFGAETRNTLRIDQRLRRGEDFAVGRRKARGKRNCVGIHRFSTFAHRIFPVAHHGAHFSFQRLSIHMRRGAFMTADDELNARQAVLQKDGVELKTVAAIDVDQIMPDLFTHGRIVTVTRDIDQHRGKTAETVQPRNGAHTRALAQRQDQFGIGGEAFRIDLEKLVTRIFFQHVDECLARVILAVEAQMLDDRIGLGANERNACNRARIGNRGEEANKAQFTNGFAPAPENLHADIIEIGTAMHRRKRICLGDDQRFGAIEEFRDFARGDSIVIILAQHTHFIIAQNSERLLRRNEIALFAGSLENQLAKAEENEMIVAQPFKKRDGFRHRGIAGQFIGALVIIDGAIKPLQHRFPVADRRAHLTQNTFQPGGKIGLGLFAECGQVNLHQADALHTLGRRKLRSFTQNDQFVLLARNIENRMHDHENLAGMIVQLTHDRVEHKGHIVVDDGDDAHRPAMGLAMACDTVVNIDDALALAVGFERGIAMKGRTFEGGGIISREIFRRRPLEEKLRKGSECLRLSSLLPLLACL
ncbi:Uncharacterised protein [Brucella suis]|nr:Uncharacterised protein [Brucella suis]